MRCTLLCDGSSDRALIPIFEWSLRQAGVTSDLETSWADFRGIRFPQPSLAERMKKALELYPCDVLFVHRDAENQPWDERLREVLEASTSANLREAVIPIIPVRMLESWLLSSEAAIRAAAGNPNGTNFLALPRSQDIEMIADPKELLFELLRIASALNGRRLRSLNVEFARTLVAGYISDFASLRSLESFKRFEAELLKTVDSHHLASWV